MQFEFNGQTGVIKDKVTGERCVIITEPELKKSVQGFLKYFSQVPKSSFLRQAKQQANVLSKRHLI
jgi:hypothetical protein